MCFVCLSGELDDGDADSSSDSGSTTSSDASEELHGNDSSDDEGNDDCPQLAGPQLPLVAELSVDALLHPLDAPLGSLFREGPALVDRRTQVLGHSRL